MLTETQCRNAKPQDKPYRLADGKGLYLEVKPNGTKAWRYRFELFHEGKPKESMFAIGEYIYVSGKETKEEAQVRRNGGRFFPPTGSNVSLLTQSRMPCAALIIMPIIWKIARK